MMRGMLGRARLGVGAVALATLVAVTACARPANIGTIARVDAVVAVRPDGSVDVVEDYVPGAAAAGGVTLTRVIAPRESDSLELVSADATGANHGTVTVDAPGRPLRVHWQLPAADGLRDASLRVHYRAYRTLFLDPPRAYLHWPVLDAGRGFAVGASRITLVLPDGWPSHAGTGMAEAGWTVTRTATGIVAVRESIADRDTATLLADTDFRIASMSQPEWQTNDDRQRNLLPSYVAGALFMFVIGGGTLVLLRKQYPPRAPGTPARPGGDPDKLMIARGLRLTAVVTTLVAAACGAVVHVLTPQLGVWIQLIPGSMVVVSVGFLIASQHWGREAKG